MIFHNLCHAWLVILNAGCMCGDGVGWGVGGGEVRPRRMLSNLQHCSIPHVTQCMELFFSIG